MNPVMMRAFSDEATSLLGDQSYLEKMASVELSYLEGEIDAMEKLALLGAINRARKAYEGAASGAMLAGKGRMAQGVAGARGAAKGVGRSFTQARQAGKARKAAMPPKQPKQMGSLRKGVNTVVGTAALGGVAGAGLGYSNMRRPQVPRY